METTIKVHRLVGRSFQAFALIFLIVLGAVAARIDHWMPRAFSFVCGVFAISAAFFLETHIDIQRGSIVRVARLFGLIPVWRHHWPVGEFVGIQCYCSSGDEISDTWMVTLQPRSGRAIDVKQFSVPTGENCAKAREFAGELSRLTGLEIVDHVV